MYIISSCFLQFHAVRAMYLLVVVDVTPRNRVCDDVLVILAEHAAIMRDEYDKSCGDRRELLLQRGQARRHLLRRGRLRLNDLLQELPDSQT